MKISILVYIYNIQVKIAFINALCYLLMVESRKVSFWKGFFNRGIVSTFNFFNLMQNFTVCGYAFTCNKTLRINQTNGARLHKWNKQILCVYDVFAVFSSFPVVRAIRSKYHVFLKTCPGISGIIFENFLKNSVKTVKKLLGIFKKYRKNLKKKTIWWYSDVFQSY